MRLVFAAIFGASLIAPTLAAFAQYRAESGRPNIILISVDTLRVDRLSCYSAAAPKTPNIDRLAPGSLTLASIAAEAWLTAKSASSTKPSRSTSATPIQALIILGRS